MHSFFTPHMFRGLLLMGLISLGSGPSSAWAIDRYVDPVVGSDQISISFPSLPPLPPPPPIVFSNPCAVIPCQTLGHAVAQAAAGDIIDLSAGSFADPNDSGLSIDKDLTTRGQGIDVTVVDAGFADRHFTIDLGATEVKIKDLTLTNGNPRVDGGGAIQVQSGLLRVVDSKLSNNDAFDPYGGSDDGHGGAIFLAAGTELIIRRSILRENDAATGGAIFSQDADVFIRKTELIDNEAASGGAIFHQVVVAGSLEILDSTFSGNAATIDGGALTLWGAVEVKRSTFSLNNAANPGGAIFMADGELTMFNSTVSENTADVGGGLSVLGPVQAAVYSCTFVGNDSLVGNGGPFPARAQAST